MKIFIALALPTLLLTACCSGGKSINEELADRAVKSAETMNKNVDFMVDLLEGKRPMTEWGETDGDIYRLQSETHLKLMTEVQAQAQAANKPKE